MSTDETVHEAPTRRDTIKYGGAVVGGGLLAGCTGESSEPTTEEDTATDESYSVTISPVGTIEFEEVPNRILTYNKHYVDMAVACGHGEAIEAMGDQFYIGYYEQLPGVEFDPSTRVTVTHDDKETIYQVDPDLILLDPTWYRVYSEYFDFDEDDIEEITQNVAPYFGNRFSRAHTDTGIEDYEYYTAWELYAKVAQVFGETERIQALKRVRDELVAHVESNLPPEAERPTVGLVAMNDWAEFSPYKIDNEGFGVSHYRPLDVRDVFAESDRTYESDGGTYDLEAMLELDPDVLIHNFGTGGFDDRYQSMLELEDDPVGSELSAVQNDRLYGGGDSMQGPIYNLFQIEMAAKQIYPEQFGEFPSYNDDGTYDISESDQLFSRKRVADIINGEF
ncbi:ABC transporter substrate-binding protein [Halohasta litorea]|uniref:ABC transporter substrate-binding protein n=1 Tax=Halohasta litorea TaxID=869891 RepID=A0ABD6DCU1_9EURY|nr:ABC transporter substrate-binding protein [Halohasta litorea]